MKDEMGKTKDELLNWMLECAERRIEGASKTVNMKFSKLTLQMWIDRVRQANERK